jgi:hypothetical protein
MLVGMVILSQFDLTVIDFVILVAGALGLAFWPSLVLVTGLVCYQAVGLALNGMAFTEATRNTDTHKALLVHLVLRLAAVVLMVYGLIEMGKRKRLAAGESASQRAADGSYHEDVNRVAKQDESLSAT